MTKAKTMGVHIYTNWLAKIDKFVGKGKEYNNFSEYARSLIREDLKKRGLLIEGELES
ncbi:MAG: hypothetical protein QXU17_06345 [Archaeoglobaceae archaeon]